MLKTKTVSVKGESVIVPVKPWYTSKTIWIALIPLLAEIVTYLSGVYTHAQFLATIAGILIIINRFSTKTAVQ